MKCYYFGMWARAGHYFYDANGNVVPRPFSLGNKIDGGLCPVDKTQTQGAAVLSVYAESPAYTVLSFWDRSGDARMNSNSNFIIEGVHDFGSAIETAKVNFPELWKRIHFEVRLAEEREI